MPRHGRTPRRTRAQRRRDRRRLARFEAAQAVEQTEVYPLPRGWLRAMRVPSQGGEHPSSASGGPL